MNENCNDNLNENKKAAKHIIIRGASEHNLKSVDADIPHGLLTVVTGVSGSGKSSLVFDTICREGRRRYLESFSAYARQFLGKLGRPSVGHISGLSPAISVDQKTVVSNPRSTVGTMTELYDFLRLLFARLGTRETTLQRDLQHPPLERRLFSFNSPHGACPACKGLGLQDRIDTELLISDREKSLRQGALVITTPTGYIIYSQVTMDVLNQVCEAHGFNTDIPWKEMTEEQKKIVLYGSDIIKIPYGKHPLESRLKWSGITAKPREEGYYKGIIPVMENILRVDRNKNILRFARSMTCDACAGTRLKPEALAVTFQTKNIAQFAALSIDQLHEFFTDAHFPPDQSPVAEPLRREILARTAIIRQLGLAYLTLDRESTTLSGGEGQRLRLATQVGSGLRGILYILDEPSIGLHHRDNRRLMDMLNQLRDNGNTVIVVEHDEDTMRSADRLMDIGPAAGIHGGEILFNGPIEELLTAEIPEDTAHEGMKKSLTRAFLLGEETIPIPPKRRSGNGNRLSVQGAGEHNLKNIDVPFRLGVLNVVTGVSGAGKSTLVHDILANFLKRELHNANTHPGSHSQIDGLEFVDKIIEIDQSPIGRTPRSNPATYTKLFDSIRDLFADLPEAKQRKWGKGRFSFNVTGGRCESCEGAGLQQIGMHFMGNVDVVCETCGGKRFNDETLEIEYNGKTIYDILEMPIDTAVDFFADHAKISRFLDALHQLGLGYISLGQSSTTLSGGEAQRIKLAAELCKPATGKTLYILDEPTTGLHAADIRILLESLERLVEKGNTVISVEHHPDFIKRADWVIDLGPGSGDAGGNLVAAGTPEEIAEIENSFTGQFLRQLFSPQTGEPAVSRSQPADKSNEPILLEGVSTHNLKNIDVIIPVNRLTVITGVSGSGKSSLAFDTIFAEGQQRFLTSFSTYARRLMGNHSRADIAGCSGLMPTIAISQKAAAHNPRSTVGTMTEIYDYYRLLYARVGEALCPTCETPLQKGSCTTCDFKGQNPLFARMFSFNHHQGACPLCKGLGVVTVCDPEKLVTDGDCSLLAGALDGSKTGKFYGDPYGQYVAILQEVSRVEGIDFSLPWKELKKGDRQIAMYGTGDTEYHVTWKFKRKNREGEHIFDTPWLGFVNCVNEEYERKHADRRGQAMLPLMTDEPCSRCHGKRLKEEFLSVYFNGLDIATLCSQTVAETITFFENLEKAYTAVPNGSAAPEHLTSPKAAHIGGPGGAAPWRPPRRGPRRAPGGPPEAQITAELRREILRRLRFLRDVGLDYLTLNRNAVTLSGGEAQRIRLANQLGSGLTGVTYVLDEPTIGLHSRDTQRLLSVLRELRDEGNTVIVVEHDAEIIRAADHIIDLGPGAGSRGGTITAEGPVAELEKAEDSKTGKYLKNRHAIAVPSQRRESVGGIAISGAKANNLQDINLRVPMGGMVVFTGVSGSGKSTLLFDVLGASLEQGKAVGCRSIDGPGESETGESFFSSSLILMDQKGIGATATSNPATYTGLFDGIRDLFAKTETAMSRGYKKTRFSFNTTGGRCEACQGAGEVRTSMDFLADVSTRCDDCGGKRYNKETLECLFEGRTIAQVLEMTVEEAKVFFAGHPGLFSVLEHMESVGLGYLQLGQPANTLSGGEAQRLKLVAELAKSKSNKSNNSNNRKSRKKDDLKKDIKQNIYVFDEPTTGLHFEDVERLLGLFHRLADQGHTLLIIEHHPDVIKNADYVVDLGPEGGDRGGCIVAMGTPEEVSQVEESYTGQMLKDILG